METFIANRLTGVPISIYEPFKRKQSVFDYIKHPVILEMCDDRDHNDRQFVVKLEDDNKFFMLDGSDFNKSDYVIENNPDPVVEKRLELLKNYKWIQIFSFVPHLYNLTTETSCCGKAELLGYDTKQMELLPSEYKRKCKLCLRTYIGRMMQ